VHNVGSDWYTARGRGVIHNNLVAFGWNEDLQCTQETEVSCNLVYEFDEPGAPCGTDLGGNIGVDPLLCDWENGDYRLEPDSPCWVGNHPQGFDCGLIGAYGLCLPDSLPVEITSIEPLWIRPFRVRLTVEADSSGGELIIYQSVEPYVDFAESLRVQPTGSVTTIEVPLGDTWPPQRFFRATQWIDEHPPPGDTWPEEGPGVPVWREIPVPRAAELPPPPPMSKAIEDSLMAERELMLRMLREREGK